jgi:hypothetical protein
MKDNLGVFFLWSVCYYGVAMFFLEKNKFDVFEFLMY